MKNIKCLLLLLCLSSTKLFAQVPNAEFETLNHNGSIRNWGITFTTSIWFDSLGVGHSDSVINSKNLCVSSIDAHSGKKAMEMQNAFNVTKNKCIRGGAFLADDSIVSSWSPKVSVTGGASLFSFWYKFMSVGNDTAMATIEAFDSTGNTIGEASIALPNTNSMYKYVSSPIQFAMGDANLVKYVYIYFGTALTDSTATFGSKLIVDDVKINPLKTNVINNNFSLNTLVYPNPCSNYITIKNDLETIINVEVFNSNGQAVLQKNLENKNEIQYVNTSSIPLGIYFLQITSLSGKKYSTKFVKE